MTGQTKEHFFRLHVVVAFLVANLRALRAANQCHYIYRNVILHTRRWYSYANLWRGAYCKLWHVRRRSNFFVFMYFRPFLMAVQLCIFVRTGSVQSLTGQTRRTGLICFLQSRHTLGEIICLICLNQEYVAIQHYCGLGTSHGRLCYGLNWRGLHLCVGSSDSSKGYTQTGGNLWSQSH